MKERGEPGEPVMELLVNWAERSVGANPEAWCSEGADHMCTESVVTIDAERGEGLVVRRAHLETDQANALRHIQ